MVGAGVVNALAVSNQHAEQRAQFQQLMPVVIISGQPRGIEAEYQSRFPEADLRD